MSQQISETRKVAYYFGMVLMVAGFLVFGSIFVTGAANFG